MDLLVFASLVWVKWPAIGPRISGEILASVRYSGNSFRMPKIIVIALNNIVDHICQVQARFTPYSLTESCIKERLRVFIM